MSKGGIHIAPKKVCVWLISNEKMLDIRETQPQPPLRCHFRTMGLVTGPTPMSLGFPPGCHLISPGHLLLGEEEEVSGAKHSWCCLGSPTSCCATWAQPPDLPEPTFLTGKG